MTIKKMFMLTGLLAGAAYLQNKGRRDRVLGKARGLLSKAKTRASELASQVESKGGEASESIRNDSGVGTGGSSRYDSFGHR